MNRTTFQELAEERARDAWALLYARQWSGLDYLAGYAVECGLKACIARHTNWYDYPDKKLAQDYYTHDIQALVKLAKLDEARKIRAGGDQDFNDNWLIVKDWNEQSRYQRWSEVMARDLFTAVTDAKTGVLPWIRAHW